jgi:glyoxylase-like metal-dependent hydrolase (beta-lactamase superfamily II)
MATTTNRLLVAISFALGVQSASCQEALRFGIETLHVQGNVFLLAGVDANATVQVGDDGVLVVDSQSEVLSQEMLSAIRTLSSGPIRYVVNTSIEADHIGGNTFLASGGDSSIAATLLEPQPVPAGARVVAHENVALRMAQEGVDPTSWPTETYFAGWHDIFFNGEAVRLFHVPAAHTDGDSLVFFRRSDVISTGEVFTTTSYPVVDLARGGSIDGLIDALNRILDLTVLARQGEGRRTGGTLIIPGEGRLCDQTDVVHYRDMVTIVRDRVLALIGQGMSLEQVVAARPTLDFDPRYAMGDTQATASFVESVYRSLSNATEAARASSTELAKGNLP